MRQTLLLDFRGEWKSYFLLLIIMLGLVGTVEYLSPQIKKRLSERRQRLKKDA